MKAKVKKIINSDEMGCAVISLIALNGSRFTGHLDDSHKMKSLQKYLGKLCKVTSITRKPVGFTAIVDSRSVHFIVATDGSVQAEF